MKKRLLPFLMALLPIAASAYDAKIDGIYYNFNGDEAEVTYENYLSASYSGIVEIPKFVTYNGKSYRVTSIGDYAFYGCSELTTAIIQFGDSLVYNENLIVNGDFSLGYEGFTTDYLYIAETGDHALYEEGKCAVGTSPHDYHQGFIEHGDHTIGTGNMLIVNGSPSNLDYAWIQNISVERGKTYEFSAWFLKANSYYDTFKEDIEFSIKGTPIMGTYDKTENDWERFYGRYTATESGEIELKIRSLSDVLKGNDFAIDDISLSVMFAYSDVNTSIGNYAFANCPKLRQVFCSSRLVPDIQGNTFEGTDIKNATLYVPAGSVNLYEAVLPWSDFGTIQAIDNDVKYIDTAQDLVAFANFVNAGGGDANAMLIADIDLSEVSSTWMPIGNWETINGDNAAYNGHFDGLGHKITGFNATASQNYFGLFGVIAEGALIEDFTIYGTLSNDTYKTGGVVGYTRDTETTIRNIHSYLNINNTLAGGRYGGIVGTVSNGTTNIENCTYSGNLSSDSGTSDSGGNYGGIVGYVNNNTAAILNITNCLFDGQVINTNATPGGCTFGGFVGYSNSGIVTIMNCLSVGSVQSTVYGQFFGAVKSSQSSIVNSYYVGDVVNGSASTVAISAIKTEVEQLTSGEICYALNGDQAEINWYQTLDEDNYPVLDDSHFIVLYIDGFYVNEIPPMYVINDNITSFNVSMKRNVRAIEFTHDFSGEWESLYLPFAIDYDAIKADFELAEIDGVVQNDDNNDGIVDFTVLSIIGFKGQMTAPNTPYLIRAKNAGEQTIVFNDVTAYPTEEATFDCSSFSTKYEFTGSYNVLGATALANRYIIQDGELVKGATSLAPCRWYMTATARNGASLNLPNKIRVMMVEDVIDGVSPLLTSPEAEGQVYNLAGQRIVNRQSLRGVNIIRYSNGFAKKVLMK